MSKDSENLFTNKRSGRFFHLTFALLNFIYVMVFTAVCITYRVYTFRDANFGVAIRVLAAIETIMPFIAAAAHVGYWWTFTEIDSFYDSRRCTYMFLLYAQQCISVVSFVVFLVAGVNKEDAM